MYVKFAELGVADQDRAVKFYSQVLGGEVATDKPYGDDGWRWVEIAFPGARTRLLLTRRDGSAPSNAPALVLVENNVAAMVATLRSQGVEIITEPREAPWEPGRIFAQFRDSEGNRIVIASA